MGSHLRCKFELAVFLKARSWLWWLGDLADELDEVISLYEIFIVSRFLVF
jgi:hypothetical protein